jgi:acyl-homoserine-lactone acylase
MKIFLSVLLWLAISVLAFADIQLKNIEIVRDEWGVPHIYAPTDEEVAYGLAWATAEDDFQSIQENFLAIRGKLAGVKGKDGAIMDFLAAFTGAKELAKQLYPKAIGDKFRKILEHYCKGLNDYAKMHPDQIINKRIFPATVEDMLAGYVLGMTLMTNVQYDVLKVSSGTINNKEIGTPRGSNALAISPKKTGSDTTFLAVNSHQPLTGPYSWYEAHLCSDEGWNILGGTFPGGATIFHGVNQHLGWAHTVSMSDLNDVYQLTMHPKNKLQYRFDGKWLTLEKKHIWMWVKVWWFIKIPVRKTFYKSIYGPTLKGGDGNFYSFRFPANMDIRAAEQWYYMNKATDFDSFYQALQMQAISGLNFIYADKKGNIFYLDNGQFPKRNPDYNWWGVLPGDTSSTLWNANDYYPLEALAQVKNPECGYVFNANNTPFLCTGDECNQTADQLAVGKFYFHLNNNRSLRMEDLLRENTLIDYQTFKRIKFDRQLRSEAYTYSISNLEDIFHLDSNQYPDIKDLIISLHHWDRNADTNSIGATIIALFTKFLIQESFDSGNISFDEQRMSIEKMVDLLRAVKKHLVKHFNTTYVRLGDVQKLVRGSKALAIGGIPDVIAATYISDYKDGTFKMDAGESYIMLVRFTADGPIIETIQPFGSSNVPGNQHYDDQMPLFVRQQLKPMSLNRDQIKIERRYHPGE